MMIKNELPCPCLTSVVFYLREALEGGVADWQRKFFDL